MANANLASVREWVSRTLPAVDTRVAHAYRVALVVKICLWHFLRGSDLAQIGTSPVTSSVVLVASVAGTVLACRKERPWVGLVIVFIIEMRNVILTFPLTLNHLYLQPLLVGLLLVGAWPGSTDPRGDEARGVRAMMAIALIVWFWAGVQKLLSGYWLDGEYFALEALFFDGPESAMGGPQLARHGYELLAAVLGGTQASLPLPMPGAYGASTLALSTWERVYLAGPTIAVVVAEMASPLLFLTKRFRRAGLIGMVIMAFVIPAGAGIFSFAFLNFAMLIPFFPERRATLFPAYGIAIGVFFVLAQIDLHGIDVIPFPWF